MKETFTIKEIKTFLEKALSMTVMEPDDSESAISNALDKAWNRGANSMHNRALVLMYTAYEEGEK